MLQLANECKMFPIIGRVVFFDLHVYTVPQSGRTQYMYYALHTSLFTTINRTCIRGRIFGGGLEQKSTSKTSGKIGCWSKLLKLSVSLMEKKIPRCSYCVCPNRSAVRECKGLGALLLISTIKRVIWYLQHAYIR